MATSLMAATLGRSVPILGGKPCQWKAVQVTASDQSVHIRASLSCPPQAAPLSVELPFLRDSDVPDTLQILVKVQSPSGEQVYSLSRQNTSFTMHLSRANRLGDYVQMGIEHIGALPSEWKNENGVHLPDGIDHILFVLALVLGGGGVGLLAKTITGFTLGHSITLALATFGLVSLPPRIVEPVIALSITYAAWETFRGKNPRNRWRIAALFGLVHGFGFAGALKVLELGGWELAKALLGFNLGVEAGQLIVISVALALAFPFWSQPRLTQYVQRGLSLLIVTAGLFWFVQRVF